MRPFIAYTDIPYHINMALISNTDNIYSLFENGATQLSEQVK